MAEKLNIYQKLAKIRKLVEVMKNDKKGYGYTYTTEESILAKITSSMEKYDLSLLPGIVPSTLAVSPYSYTKTKVTQKGEIYEENVNEILVTADTTWTWVNNENPEERIVVPWALVGHQTDASQSFGSGLTYSSRYFLLKYFNVSTVDSDPDKWRSDQRKAEEEAEKIVVDAIINEVDNIIKSYLLENENERDNVKKLTERYVKGGNYFSIKKADVAAKLLEEVKNKLVKEN